MNPYITPAQEEKNHSKKEEIEASNKRKKKVLKIITLAFGVIVGVCSIDEDVNILGSFMVGIFTSLLVGLPLLLFYVFTKKR